MASTTYETPHSPEALQQRELIFQGNSYSSPRSEYIKDWHELSVFDNNDGTHTLRVSKIPLDTPPTKGKEHKLRTNDLEADFNSIAEVAAYIDSPGSGSYLRNLGYSAKMLDDTEHPTGEITYDNPIQLSRRLDIIRSQGIYVPALQQTSRVLSIIRGGAFKNEDLAEAQEHGAFLVSRNKRYGAHDMTNHAYMNIAPAESTYKRIGARSRQVINELPGSKKYDPSLDSSPFDRHFRSIELWLGHESLPLIDGALQGNDRDREWFKIHLSEMMFGLDEKTEAQRQIAEQETAATLNHVKAIGNLDPSLFV